MILKFSYNSADLVQENLNSVLMNLKEIASQVVPVVKNLLASSGDTRDTVSIPGSGISST